MPNGSYKISYLRTMGRLASRNAGDVTVYPTAMVDFAIQRAADELIRECRLCLRVDQQATVADTTDYAVTPTTFRCDRLQSVFLTGTNVVVDAACLDDDVIEGYYVRGGYLGDRRRRRRRSRLHVVGYEELNDMTIGWAESGQPEFVAFQNDGTYSLYPSPDQVYTVNRRWSDLFTTFVPGVPLTSFTLSTSGGTVTAATVIDGSDNLGTTGSITLTTATGSGATFTGTLTNSSLAGILVSAGGAGYTAADYLNFNGNETDDRVTNLSDEAMRNVLMMGVPAYLTYQDPEKKLAPKLMEIWQDYIKRSKGKLGGLGNQMIIRRG